MYFVEVTINKKCGCGQMIEGLLIEGTRDEVTEQVKTKFKTAKSIHINCIYLCEDIGDNILRTYLRYP